MSYGYIVIKFYLQLPSSLFNGELEGDYAYSMYMYYLCQETTPYLRPPSAGVSMEEFHLYNENAEKILWK